MKQIVLYLLTLYTVLAVFAYFFAEKYVFYPPPASYHDDDHIIKLTTQNGAVISAVYLPNQAARYTLLVSHGNAEDLGNMMPFLTKLQTLGYSVFAYDYEGYGTSEGKPTEKHVYDDIQTAYLYLTQTRHIPAHDIIVYGRSLGAAAAIDLASKFPVGGVIVESGFVSLLRVMTRIPLFPFEQFNNLSKIKKITAPILIIHGKKDHTIGFWHGEKLYEAANPPKDFLWIDDADHNNTANVGGETYWRKLQDFQQLVTH